MNAEKLSITLPGDMAKTIRGFVESGNYASNSEVIRDAMRLWLLRKHEQENRLESIKARISEADKNPERISSANADAYLAMDGSNPQGIMLDELRKKKAGIEHLVSRYGGRNVRVFGSVARREEHPDSDVDLLIEFPKGYSMFKQRIPLTRELRALIGRNVDLLPDREINKHLRDSILEDAVAL